MLLREFNRDRRGNIIPIFALAIVPVMGFVGAAVDYSRASSIRTSMQAALDATALYLSKEAGTLSAEALAQKAGEVFKATFTQPEAKSLNVTATYASTDSGFKVVVSATASVDTTLTRILGHNSINIGGNAEAVWGIRKLELALALDNTGSMSSNNKMTELKKAAKDLLNTLKTSVKKEGDVKIAIIPFATDVNVGTKNVGATWLDWTTWDEENGDDVSTTTCTGKKGKKKKCTTSSTWVPDDHKKWNGCVTDRDQENDVKDTTPSAGVKATLFPANQADNCPVEMQPLTTNWGQLTSTIESMKPTGMTNVTIGLAWAWHALTSNAPLTEAVAPAQDLDKVIIILTDGDNTENRWSNNQGEIDARTKKVCANAKAAGIRIYTIRVIDGNASLLKECATTPSMYYDVQNASQLSGTFGQIAKSLTNLRLAK